MLGGDVVLSQEIDGFSSFKPCFTCSLVCHFANKLQSHVRSEGANKGKNPLVVSRNIDKCSAKNSICPEDEDSNKHLAQMPAKSSQEIRLGFSILRESAMKKEVFLMNSELQLR